LRHRRPHESVDLLVCDDKTLTEALASDPQQQSVTIKSSKPPCAKLLLPVHELIALVGANPAAYKDHTQFPTDLAKVSHHDECALFLTASSPVGLFGTKLPEARQY
jgi:hypothetical protein